MSWLSRLKPGPFASAYDYMGNATSEEREWIERHQARLDDVSVLDDLPDLWRMRWSPRRVAFRGFRALNALVYWLEFVFLPGRREADRGRLFRFVRDVTCPYRKRWLTRSESRSGSHCWQQSMDWRNGTHRAGNTSPRGVAYQQREEFRVMRRLKKDGHIPDVGIAGCTNTVAASATCEHDWAPVVFQSPRYDRYSHKLSHHVRTQQDQCVHCNTIRRKSQVELEKVPLEATQGDSDQ